MGRRKVSSTRGGIKNGGKIRWKRNVEQPVYVLSLDVDDALDEQR